MTNKALALLMMAFASTPTVADDNWVDTAAMEAKINKGDYGTVTSLLVIKGGKTIYEGYFNGADAATLHNTRSATKTITSMAVGAAVDDGLFTVNTPAAGFFTDIAPFKNPDPRKLEVSVEDLLTMSSILECDDNDMFSRGNESRMHNVEDWSSFFWDLPIRGYPSWIDPPSRAKYGRAFFYCSAGTEIVGQTVERAAKEPFHTYVERKLFEPLGITDFKWQFNAVGDAHKSGGLALTSLGLAKFAEMQRLGGLYDGKRVLSEDWTQEAVKPRAVAYADRDIEYGYQWWLAPYEVAGERFDSHYMAGNGGNRILVMPSHELVVVVTKTDFNTRGMHQKTDALINDEIIARLTR
ncbi:MAG: serine hydrolase [Kordiimonadaceae bacterium]|nr:serine hydrolase [Kordiimonadaceae bacterium]MBO6567987.1 serine hydrolase [Kordiimonadaceae bacterium]MBO6964283.1 serine hydrolase [Kordiimonadaceae bacterium]